MANIKPINQSAQKWSDRAAGAAGDFAQGVNNPRTPWAAATIAAEGNFQSGITAAIANKSFSKGVTKAGDATWKKGAAGKGPGRYVEGVLMDKDNWPKGFAPYQNSIAGLTLPARGPKGSPQNIQRVAAVATALRAVKMGK